MTLVGRVVVTRTFRCYACTALMVWAVVLFSGQPADTVEPIDLERLRGAVSTLVHKHYPGATVTVDGRRIRFEFKTRTFVVHELSRTGDRWQDAHEEPGPQPGGIHGDLELRPGPYAGAAVVPQTFDRRYFYVYLDAPYSARIDQHLYVRLKYPSGAMPEFVSEFRQLTDAFEAHLSRKAP